MTIDFRDFSFKKKTLLLCVFGVVVVVIKTLLRKTQKLFANLIFFSVFYAFGNCVFNIKYLLFNIKFI